MRECIFLETSYQAKSLGFPCWQLLSPLTSQMLLVGLYSRAQPPSLFCWSVGTWQELHMPWCSRGSVSLILSQRAFSRVSVLLTASAERSDSLTPCVTIILWHPHSSHGLPIKHGWIWTDSFGFKAHNRNKAWLFEELLELSPCGHLWLAHCLMFLTCLLLTLIFARVNMLCLSPCSNSFFYF